MCPMTFRRGVRAAETVLGIKIRYIRHVRNETDSLTVGNSGYYVIDDWGCVNKKKFLAHVENLVVLSAYKSFISDTTDEGRHSADKESS